MGDSSDGDSACLFNAIMGDMKTMVPIWEDFLVKGSKFYSAIKATASTADSFLDSFQKLADATTSSKGATRDIGVLFTKLVMRHRSIENKLKTYVGIITDSLFGPLQEKLEEWKKSASQLEKDHSKDFKKAKGEAKKSASEVLKLKKKVVKKGRPEYHEQYKDALKLASINVAALEDQERQYLRRLMTEERSRVVFFFNCYRPVVEQELSLVGEIENLQTIVEETIKQCKSPSTLPLIAEDAINNYKAPDQVTLPKSETSSPPPSPTLESARQRAFTSIPKGTGSLQRSHTVSAGSGYSTLRKKGSGGPAPKPVGIPTLTKSPTRSLSNTDGLYDAQSHGSFHSSSGNVSNFSSMSSLSIASTEQLVTDPETAAQGTAAYEDSLREQVAYYTQHDAKIIVSGTNGVQHLANPMQTTRTSWSSLETSDSSGIGSYCSLASQGRAQQAQEKHSGYHSDGQYEMTEGCLDYDVNDEMYIQMSQLQANPVSMQQNILQQQQFKRNADTTSSLRGTRGSGAPSYRRANSLTDGDSIPSMAEYRMTMPRRPSNTVYAKNTQSGAKPTAFQIFATSQSPAQLRAKLSPTGSPVKSQRPPAPARKVSSPPNLFGSSSRSAQHSHSGSTLAGNSSGVYAASNASGIYASSAEAGIPHEGMVYQTNTGVSDPNIVYTSRTRKESFGNEYAVPNIHPAPPKSPDGFPPPPAQMQQQQSYHPEQQQQQQPAKYQTTQQLQNYLQQQELAQRLAAQQQQQPAAPYQPSEQPQYQVHNYQHHQQQQHYQERQPQYQQQQAQQYQQHQSQYTQQQQQQQQHAHQQQTQQFQPPQYQRFHSDQSQQFTQQTDQRQCAAQRRPLSSSHSADDDMPSARPGSFLDEIQQKRTLVKRRTQSVEPQQRPFNS